MENKSRDIFFHHDIIDPKNLIRKAREKGFHGNLTVELLEESEEKIMDISRFTVNEQDQITSFIFP